MVALITLEVGKQHLRILHTDFDADIQRKINGASAVILNYIKAPDQVREWHPLPPSAWDADTVPDDIASAVCMELEDLYDNRNAGNVDNPNIAMGYLTPRITAVLHRWRDPAVA